MSRELDTEVAQTVFALNKRLFCTQHPGCYHAPDPERNGTIQGWTRCEQHGKRIIAVPQYSADVAAAWLVVERLQVLGHGLIVKAYPVGYAFAYSAAIPGTMIGAQAETAPLAICQIALKAVETATEGDSSCSHGPG